MKRIYLDHNASTPIAPVVADVMRTALSEGYGNPSSLHWAGTPARTLVDEARLKVASLLGCHSDEIIFTSGGSEANNMALKGAFFASDKEHRQIITTAVEHPAIVEPCRFLERLGATITWLSVDQFGRVDPDDLGRAITDDTILISVMQANNEVGTIQPIQECAAIAKAYGIPFHTDAAQSVGKIETKVDTLGVDMLSIAGHKIYAPKGVGALYMRRDIQIEPFMHGAGHECGRRAGTESAMLNAALGAACDLVSDLSPMAQIRSLRDHFWERLQGCFGNRVALNGHPELRLPNTLNVSFVGQDGAALLSSLYGVAASTGSACHEGNVELSPILEAMGISETVGMGAIRFSLGRNTSVDELDIVVEKVAASLSANAPVS